MTREEFKDWANDAWACCTMYEGEQFVLGLRRATLQEAARAVCERCETDAPAYDPECGWWYHTDLIGCDATPIHDLLAAMDKEGEHE